MTSMQRVLTTMQQREPDRIPFFLHVTMHGARELGLTIREYFSRAEHVAEGQIRMREKYGHDCLNGAFYAPAEVEAWGGEVIFRDDGPPNSGMPIIRSSQDIFGLTPPSIHDTPCLAEVLKAQRLMKERIGNEAPIIGLAVSPFSLPVMQMGFEAYIELMYKQPTLFARLMAVNEEFCVAWANAQLEAGATFICYADPVASPTIVPPDMYRTLGFPVAKRTLARIKGPTAIHFASGRCLAIIDDIVRTGTSAIGVSTQENLADVKTACSGRLAVVGNLNGIEMRRWTPEETRMAVKAAIAEGGRGGGFILSDNHGEIPWQVQEAVLHEISETVHQWGGYPLQWVATDG